MNELSHAPIEIIGMILSAGAIYGAIRNDIKNIHYAMKDLKEASDRAHRRIDEVFQNMADSRK
jgi:hypothetical protein